MIQNDVPYVDIAIDKFLKDTYERFRNFNDNVRSLIGIKRGRRTFKAEKYIDNIYKYAPKHPYTKLPYYLEDMKLVLDFLITSGTYNYAIYLDVKNLKRVNEIEGYKNHVHGDEYLKIVGDVLRRYFREDDVKINMFGADEIIILLNINLNKVKDPQRLITQRIEMINKEIQSEFERYAREKGIPYSRDSFEVGLYYKIIDLKGKGIRSVEDIRKEVIKKESVYYTSITPLN